MYIDMYKNVYGHVLKTYIKMYKTYETMQNIWKMYKNAKCQQNVSKMTAKWQPNSSKLNNVLRDIFRKYEICVWLNPRSVLRLFAMVSCVTSFLSTAAVTIGMIKPATDI